MDWPSTGVVGGEWLRGMRPAHTHEGLEAIQRSDGTRLSPNDSFPFGDRRQREHLSEVAASLLPLPASFSFFPVHAVRALKNGTR